MPEHEGPRAPKLPTDVATEIYGAIECVLADHLRTVVQYIEGASRVTSGQLNDRFHRG